MGGSDCDRTTTSRKELNAEKMWTLAAWNEGMKAKRGDLREVQERAGNGGRLRRLVGRSMDADAQSPHRRRKKYEGPLLSVCVR